LLYKYWLLGVIAQKASCGVETGYIKVCLEDFGGIWLFLVDKIWTGAPKLLLILLNYNNYLWRTGFYILGAF
jgi:hypothetical protein